MRRLMMLAAAAASITMGCGDSGPKFVPVNGTLTLNGDPLEGAGITFAPDPTNPVATSGGASTGPDGSFTVKSGDNNGLAAGKYKVLVTKFSLKNGAKIPDEFKDDPIMAASLGLAVESLPPDYSNANTTPLSLEVPDEGGTFDFDVKQARNAK